MNSRHLTNGTFLVIIGLLLLSASLGITPSIPWWNLLSFWPILFVIAGLRLLFPRGVLALLAPLVLILTITAAFSGYSPANFTRQWWGEYKSQLIQADSLKPTALLNIRDIPMGNIDLKSDAALPGGTVKVTSHSNLITANQVPSIGQGNLFTLQRSSSRRFPNNLNAFVSQPIDISISSAEQWDFSFTMGIVSGVLDLTDIQWNKLKVDSGISHLTLNLKNSGKNQEIEFRTGISHLTLYIPTDINLRITSQTPFFLRKLEKEGFKREQDVYTSPNFSPTLPYLEMHLETGIGLISVHWI